MEIHFCDLCNESVPEADLALGRAIRRGERVICAVCERTMSSAAWSSADGPRVPGGRFGGASPAAAATGAAPAASGSAPAARPVGARASSAGLVVAVVALLFSAGAAGLLVSELNREREERRADSEAQRVEAAGRLARQEGLLRELGTQREALGRELRGRLDEHGTTARAGLDQAGARLDALDRGLEEISRTLEALRADLAQVGEDGQRRLDEFAGRFATQREERRQLELRIEELAQGLSAFGAGEPRPSALADSAGPAWMGRVGDLSSVDASVRYYAVVDLAASGDPAVAEHIAPLLADGDLFVQMAAARVLGELGAPAAIEPLIGALEDPQDAVRETAVLALRAITGRNFRFDPFANPAERARRVAAWREWWAKAKADYL